MRISLEQTLIRRTNKQVFNDADRFKVQHAHSIFIFNMFSLDLYMCSEAHSTRLVINGIVCIAAVAIIKHQPIYFHEESQRNFTTHNSSHKYSTITYAQWLSVAFSLCRMHAIVWCATLDCSRFAVILP